MPILAELETRHTWNQAVDVVMAALEPLGSEYCGALERGLAGRWCDRYENQGKQSGAFSCRLVRRRSVHPDELPARRARPRLHAGPRGGPLDAQLLLGQAPAVQYYNYTIFVAEVASTFNEQLLSRHLLRPRPRRPAAGVSDQPPDRRHPRHDHPPDDVRRVREADPRAGRGGRAADGRRLQARSIASCCERYFGPDFAIDDELSLECLRIPHFYRAFYVYKYATGLSAAIALAERVTGGGQRELDDYLGFLKGGCSKDPLDLLRDAGVDMEQPAAVDTALEPVRHRWWTSWTGCCNATDGAELWSMRT